MAYPFPELLKISTKSNYSSFEEEQKKYFFTP